jgi:formate hydrogenlyase transcriptional activator
MRPAVSMQGWESEIWIFVHKTCIQRVWRSVVLRRNRRLLRTGERLFPDCRRREQIHQNCSWDQRSDRRPQRAHKCLIARAIHDRSHRKERTFVKLNCAAIPTGLLESELFGHERGAFTGAIAQKIGRLELADQGSLFLDEVGDIPIEIQPKLLRALQEREFERLGSNRTKQVDVRLVAATNRDLEKMIEDREFRSDLYYRLNVFPIRIPPLRERPEDIPLPVRYFTQKYSRRMRKEIDSIPAAAMKKLSSWHWPGNIRELENFIERSVILTRGTALQAPIGEMSNNGRNVSVMGTREANERDEIVRILKVTNGRVAGPNGAAARMDIKRTTLISRMKKLGIDPRKVS